VVLYNEDTILGWRVGSVPLEDFVYGLALVLSTSAVYEWLRGRKTSASWLERRIEARLGGYRQTLASEPERQRHPAILSPSPTPSIAVIGGGLAGVSAASYLAEAGCEVVVYERNNYLGGKLAGWRVEHKGASYPMEHGFHAFFRHYYNLNDFLVRVGADQNLKSVGSYSILRRDGRAIKFDDERSAPALNLIDLARRGMYDLRAVMKPQLVTALLPLLQYDENRTFAAYDHVSYQEFADRVQLPDDLSLAFTTFARAFFSDPDRLSLAELIKSFHFYYLSHDLGLVYDYLDGKVEDKLIAPIRADLLRRGVELRLGEAPDLLTPREGGGFVVAGREFDRVVLATDVGAARGLLEASDLSPWAGSEAPPPAMQSGQGYAVWRLWLPQPIEHEPDLPVFVTTERDRVLDAVAFIDRVDPELSEWAAEHGGTVIELHCYAVPVGCTEADLRIHFRRELQDLLGVSETMRPAFEILRFATDFTALGVGMHASRPTTRAGVEGLYFAGDWIRLPCPAMLMEAAHVSGRLAADAIFDDLGLPTVGVTTVPQVGLLCPAA
jgi:isorenieratene synthase